MEIVVQFCTGSLDVSETYCDNFRLIAAKYVSSIGGFGFDFVTSIPWSFNDLYAYQVNCKLQLYVSLLYCECPYGKRFLLTCGAALLLVMYRGGESKSIGQ